MMIWTLVFIGLTSPIFEMFVVKRTSIHQTKNNNITFGWDSQTKTDLSLTNLVCFFLSEPLKVLYEMINGAEHPESQHQQFSGRVQLDRDALREGQIRLHLSTVTAEDSGNYRCDVAANYDQIMRRWELEASEHYVLNVTQTSHGDNSDVLSPTPKVTPGKKPTAGVRCHDWKTVKEVLGVANIALMIFAGVAVLISAAVTHLREFIHLRSGQG